MPTVIDSLVLELGLDPAKFTQQQRDAVNSIRSMEAEQLSAGKRIEAETRRIGNVLTDFRRTALQATAIFLGGMGVQQFTDFITKLDASTGRLGTTMNMSANDVSIWQGAVKQAGGTAEEANASLSGLSGEMNRFMLTGQSAMLPVLSRLGVSLVDSNRNLKTAGQLWLDIADSIQGMDSAKAAAFLQMIPGATQGMINLALLGPGKMREYLELQRQIGATTKESAEEAQKYQRALANLESSSQNLGRTIITTLTPALVAMMDALRNGLSSLTDTPEQRTKRLAEMDNARGETTTQETRRRFGNVPQWLKDALNRGMLANWLGKDFFEDDGKLPAIPQSAPQTPAGGGSSRSTVPLSSADQERRIREKATARGIDPNIAVAVAKSEGLFNYVGDQGTSFGPFQLHYKNNIPGLSNAGLGDDFTRQTGLDARDPSTIDAQIDFALDHAARSGWGSFHGWKGGRFAGIGAGDRGGARGGAGASTVNIGTLNVNAPQAKDATGIARELGPALERSVTAGAANQGPN